MYGKKHSPTKISQLSDDLKMLCDIHKIIRLLYYHLRQNENIITITTKNS